MGGYSNNTGRAVISFTMLMIAGLQCDGGVRALVTPSPSHRRASGAPREKKVRLRLVIGAEGVFEIDEALLGREIRAESLAAHSAIGCSGVFCKSCDPDHSTNVCGTSRILARNSSSLPTCSRNNRIARVHQSLRASGRDRPAAPHELELEAPGQMWLIPLSQAGLYVVDGSV